MTRHHLHRLAGAGLVAMILGSTALGQDASSQFEPIDAIEIPEWLAMELADQSSEAVRRYRASRSESRALETEIRKLRHEYFRSRNTELRQIGISKLRTYTDAAAYPVLMEVFRRDRMDVRSAILDMLMDQRSADADVSLVWASIFDKDMDFRVEALKRMAARVDETDGASDRIVWLVGKALDYGTGPQIDAAARAADNLNIVAVIPQLINAQFGGTTAGIGSGGSTGDLAWIMIARQVAFVSDLTPVVSQSAVAFDPQLSVISEGVLLRIGDAVVTTYRFDVHNSLLGLTSRAWGQDTASLGWSRDAWDDWYRGEFEPFLAQQELERAAEQVDTSNAMVAESTEPASKKPG